MPSKDRFDPRQFFGYTGSPLPVPTENVPMPQQMRDRFERNNQSAFVPYVDVFDTLARSQDYQRAGHAIQIGDAENEFMGNLDAVSASPSGLNDFLQKHPAAALSPMVRTWQRMQQPARKDPYEAMVAKEGSDYLEAYRAAIAEGQDPMDAFSEFRDVVKKETEANKTAKDDELFFVEKGGDLEDFGLLQQKGAGRAEMLDFIKKKGKPLTSTEAGKLSKLQTEMDTQLRALDPQSEESKADHDREKIEAFKIKYGKEPETGPEWEEAFMLLKEKKIGPKQKEYDEYLTILEENGKRVPKPKTLPTAPVPAAKTSLPAAPTAPAPTAPKPKAGLSPLSQVRSALKP